MSLRGWSWHGAGSSIDRPRSNEGLEARTLNRRVPRARAVSGSAAAAAYRTATV